MFITKELILQEDISIRVTVKDYYLITDVFLILRAVVRDKEVEQKFRIDEPYGRLINHVLDCKKYGTEVRK